MFRFLTSGESHGPSLATIIEGLPAGMPLTAEPIDAHLRRRQGGYGRGARQKIETDSAEILSGVRFGETLGSPVTLLVRNRDWENWKDRMRIEPRPDGDEGPKAVTVPRPGHADYAGLVKYGHDDIRNVLERASARNTATLVAVGAVARELLGLFGIRIVSHVVRIGSEAAPDVAGITADELYEQAEASPVRCADADTSERIVALIDQCKRRGDTLGGVFEVVAFGLPVGLGSYVHWDKRIDGRVAQALMSIQAIKGVEFGMGFASGAVPGSQVHDEFTPGDDAHGGGVQRLSNRAGGTEGGITNGEPLVVRAVMKPIATLMRQLQSVNLQTGEAAPAFAERSDVCAVPAAAVVGEAMVGIALAQAFQEKFGGDSLRQMRAAYEAYRATYQKP
uniref:Chorismate synthase n=1 Tax=uncultured Armatimonadetes bacterium TaxID=157466 RepID=A0A6J4HVN6_9BACT|nr:Chorismate synthase [uncultured Armatimonadetes bacterium]